MEVDRGRLRDALTRFPAGVTIVTTVDVDGAPWGFTASAFSSVSLDPPLVLVCLDETADCHPSFQTSKGFAVNVLQPHHEPIARRFASKGADKFGPGEFALGAFGLPVLPDALAVLECTIHTRLPAGDHTILLGHVEACAHRDGAPMVYFDRAFRELA